MQVALGLRNNGILKLAQGCKLYILMDGDSQLASNMTMLEVAEDLAARGFQVDIGIAEEVVTQPEKLRVTHDLYVIKSNTELSLSLAGVLHVQGARMINPYLSCVTVKDKIVTAKLLKEGGIPIPQSWVTGNIEMVRHVVERTPVVIKPHRGNRGKGVRVVQNVQELFAMTPPDPPMLVQEFVEAGGEELKVYVVGKEVFGVRKASPRLGLTPQRERSSRAGRPCAISDEVRDIALRCAEISGLGLLGLDVLESLYGPRVIDINAFPSYAGVPNAAGLIADFIANAIPTGSASGNGHQISDLGEVLANISGFRTGKPSAYEPIILPSNGRLVAASDLDEG